MVALSGTFSHIKPYKALILGDLMLDTYTVGSVKRISPEAPVTVLNVLSESSLPGGAGNVALNLASLGGQVTLAGRLGKDAAGETLREELQQEGIEAKGLVYQQNIPTPVKNRLIASNQQLMRVDLEEVKDLSARAEAEVISMLPELMEGQQVVAISDYAKGFLTPSLLHHIIAAARERNIPVIVDPKRGDYRRYKGATVIKPNQSEAWAASGLDDDATLDEVAEVLLKKTEAEHLMITRSQEGIAVFSRNGERQDFPVRIREVKDVTGAGDTVLATLACALSNGLSIHQAAQLANIAAGVAIERLGCVRVSLSELAARLLHFDSGNKIFGQEQLFALNQSLQDRRYVIIGMHSRDNLTTTFFHRINELYANGLRDLIIFLTDPDADENFIQFLASLKEVKFIVVRSAALEKFALSTDAEAVYRVSNGHMDELDCPAALLKN